MTTGGLLCGRAGQALCIACRTSCHTGPCGRPDGSVSPDLCWWRRDPWSSLAPHALLSVGTSRGHPPDPAGALGACAARGGPPLLRSGAPGAPVPRHAWPTPAPNRGPASRDLRVLWDALAGPRGCAPGACRQCPRLQEAPAGDPSRPGQRDPADRPEAGPARPTPGLLPRRPPALRRQADPAPRPRDGPRPPRAMAGLGHPPCPAALATLGRWWRAPGARAALRGRLQVPPGTACPHQAPGTLHPEAAHGRPWTDLRHDRLLTRAERRAACARARRARCRQAAPLRPRALQAGPHGGGQQRAVLLGPRLARGLDLPVARPPHALTGQPALPAMAHPRPGALRGQAFPVALPPVCLVHTGPPSHPPDLPLPGRGAPPPRQACVHVQASRLGAAGAAMHRKAGRVHHGVLSAMPDAQTLAPTPIAARLVATDAPRVFGPATAVLGPADCLSHRQDISCSTLPCAGPRRCTRGAAERPGVLPQCAREKPGGGPGGLLSKTGRCGCGHRRAPSSWVSKVAKKRHSSGLPWPGSLHRIS